jgi:bifunctional NMN adenylyltransferase/nudix hydrolase
MQEKLGFVILRAQPLHDGHKHLILEAKSKCDVLLVILGSANKPRSIKNPYTYKERELTVTNFLNLELVSDTYVFPLNDYDYSNSQWLSDVSSIIEENNKTQKRQVVMFGHAKPDNLYLDWFPQYEYINISKKYDINATQIRNGWFESAPKMFEESVVDDYTYFKNEKLMFSTYPYPETLNFNCADAIVECSGHILLIKRGNTPGKGTWALPGGFKNANETFVECAIRELVEETNLRVPKKVLIGSIVNKRLFDSPTRGNGLPRITMGVHIAINLNSDNSLPKANGADDAAKANWFPIQSVMNSMQLYDDHDAIIQTMCSVLPVPAHKNPKYRFQA